ncbi:MAG: 2-oxo acid dehydrogenase subunit E2 [Lachnospiraceae bacterium]|nr:2-oxo acid dehydrogenase subunit E2 [Lachnospiraceae bacterium]
MKRKGDRKDGKRVPISGLMQCCIDLKPGRMENEVYINQKMNVTPLVQYIKEKNDSGEHYTFFHAFAAAIGKTIYNRPRLNQFICNRHLYAHNDVTLAFVAKMSLDDRSEEIMLIIDIKPEDTITTIKEQISDKVSNLRQKKEKVDKKGSNSAIDVLGHLPNIIRVPIFGVMKFLDKRGWIPSSLVADNIYYSSMIISNLGSIHCGAIYHNLANFGTSSSLATMGEIVPTKVVNADGTEEIRQICEFGITLDERIADGFYFAKSAQMIEYLLMHPHLLEESASNKVTMA